ncbi:MAG: AmmeMemoRadiSam system radical SAM enzyme [Lachnospiraceae bacterium]|nr:AmmeMemoRadiSam system radical SAM enzyme [Lachnospiraceae bacterium]
MPNCEVCFRKCSLSEGQTGFCGARICANGKVVAANYGRITSAALDPIEKKPLKRFMPGAKVLSVGSYGCNLRCPYCQNHEISWSREAMELADHAEYVSPEELVQMALELRSRGNVGIAFTYNEPLIGYEFVRDTAKLAKEAGLKNVLVTNGMASKKVLDEISPYIDAMNIDLKAFTDYFYRDYIQGDLAMVKDFIEGAAEHCHVELTTLIIPGENDSEEEMRELSQWVASLRGKVPGDQIPLHVTRFFPQFHVTDKSPTPTKKVLRLADVARENLKFVYTGNI